MHGSGQKVILAREWMKRQRGRKEAGRRLNRPHGSLTADGDIGGRGGGGGHRSLWCWCVHHPLTGVLSSM